MADVDGYPFDVALGHLGELAQVGDEPGQAHGLCLHHGEGRRRRLRAGGPRVGQVGQARADRGQRVLQLVVEPAQEAAMLLADPGRRPLGRRGPAAGQPPARQRHGRQRDAGQHAGLRRHQREGGAQVETHPRGEPREQRRRDGTGEDGQQRRYQQPPARGHYEPSTSGTNRYP